MSAAHQTLNTHSTAGPRTETPILTEAIARIAAVHEPSVKTHLPEFIPNLSRAEPRARTKSTLYTSSCHPAITITIDTSLQHHYS